jgi:hypothetical protein
LAWGRVGAEDVDVELVQGAAELGHAAFGLIGLLVRKTECLSL